MRLVHLGLIFTLVLVTGCGERIGIAPVVELKWQPPNNRQKMHTVRAGDTLYSIAFHYDKDYRQLAAFNHLISPYRLKIGQILYLHYPPERIANHTIISVKQAIQQPPPKRLISNKTSSRWLWPAQGRVITMFSPAQGKKGIDIAGKKRQAIRAAQSGIVAYAGSGLAGYGNLIIIKHEGQFLTAYGNNARNLITEGQKIKAGQVIAEMGMVERKFWGVHFEIRKAGQPVNPLSFLPTD